GPALVPGNPEESLLYNAILRTGKLQMPPGKQGLSPEEIKTVRDWIQQGAPWDAVGSKKESSWWSFRKPTRPAVPAVRNTGWVRTPADAFILRPLEKRGLARAAPADRQTLIRRAYFDLHGLPPAPEDVTGFVNDLSPDAWERLVDRLLDSPRYGERWGRLWLDV